VSAAEQVIAGRPDVTVCVVSWNTKGLLRNCLRSLDAAATRTAVAVDVVDNASTDGSVGVVRAEFPHVRLVANTANVGFARAVNQSLASATGRYVLLLNSDAEATPGSIDELVAFMDRTPGAGLATARLVSPDGSAQHCAQAMPSVPRTLLEATRLHKLLPAKERARLLLGPYFTYDVAQRVGWTWGTALICRRAAVEQVGPLSERFFLYGEDLDWSLRMGRAGWQVWFCPSAVVVHHGSGSAPPGQREAERRRVIRTRSYEALALHRSRPRMAALHAASALSGGLEWLSARARRRPTGLARETIAFHLKAAAGPLLRRGAT